MEKNRPVARVEGTSYNRPISRQPEEISMGCTMEYTYQVAAVESSLRRPARIRVVAVGIKN